MATCVELIGRGGYFGNTKTFCRIDIHLFILDSFPDWKNLTERSSQGLCTVFRMASLLKKTNFLSQLRSQSQVLPVDLFYHLYDCMFSNRPLVSSICFLDLICAVLQMKEEVFAVSRRGLHVEPGLREKAVRFLFH